MPALVKRGDPRNGQSAVDDENCLLTVKEKWRTIVLLFAFWLLQLAPVRANWIFDLRTGVLYDSNLSRSNRAADRLDDAAWHSSLSVGRGFQLSDDLRASVFGEWESHVWGTYEGLNNVRPGLAANLRQRFGLGKNAPWVRLETKLAYADFAEGRRSGWDFQPGLRAGVNVAERFALEAGYLYSLFAARDVIFDGAAHRASVRGKFELSSSTQIAVGYTYRDGDVNSHAVPPRPDIVAIAKAFGPVDTFDTPYVAYRFEAVTHSVSLDLSHALNGVAALQASYEWQHTRRDSLQYTNHVAELAVALSF